MRVFSDIIRPNISTSLQQYHLEKYEITFHTVGFVIKEQISPELKKLLKMIILCTRNKTFTLNVKSRDFTKLAIELHTNFTSKNRYH